MIGQAIWNVWAGSADLVDKAYHEGRDLAFKVQQLVSVFFSELPRRLSPVPIIEVTEAPYFNPRRYQMIKPYPEEGMLAPQRWDWQMRRR